MPGAMEGITVVELASEWGAYAGKVLAELGADVVLVEPPEGHPTRGYGPFADDRPDPEGSLWFWHYNTSKRGVTLDLDTPAGRDGLRSLLDRSDVLLEAEPPGRLSALDLGYPQLRESWPDLLVVSITPFGPDGPRRDEHVTDLTLLATGGPVWSCGYDDHTLPPVRGGGNQAMHTGGHFAVMSLLVALIARESGGPGQLIDVNLNAAANVTTEFASYGWLAAEQTVQRQTGRHANPTPTQATQFPCADGRWLNTGVLPRRPDEFAMLVDWLTDLDLLDEFPLSSLLEVGAKEKDLNPARIPEEPIIAEIFAASREATAFIAAHLPAYDAFIGFQERGIAVGPVLSPEEAMVDPHFVARGFPVTVDDDRLGRPVVYPGAPYRFTRTPWELKNRSPRLGEHNHELL
ncbi:MAG: CoA transferase [Acidimicrobiaceae bacterium]|nr:CoA transferase [Acidimicrobiaceae bacterium]